jgi:hypothetical protein
MNSPHPLPATAQPDFSPFDEGVRALLDAQALAKAEGGLTSALLLSRAALRHLLVATLLERGQIGPTCSQEEQWRLARLVAVAQESASKVGWLAGVEDWFEEFIVSPAGDLALARVPERERRALLESLLTLAFRLVGPLDLARNGALRRAQRRRRLIAWGTALVLLLGWFALRPLIAAPNLARGKPVVVVDPAFGISPVGAVDGDQLTVGFHSSHRKDPSVTIDLGKVYPISRIELFNRPDCCQERAVPLLVQTSKDGQTFTTIRREAHTFFHLTVRPAAPTSARYVRLVRSGTNVFHLSEIEVY